MAGNMFDKITDIIIERAANDQPTYGSVVNLNIIMLTHLIRRCDHLRHHKWAKIIANYRVPR